MGRLSAAGLHASDTNTKSTIFCTLRIAPRPLVRWSTGAEVQSTGNAEGDRRSYVCVCVCWGTGQGAGRELKFSLNQRMSQMWEYSKDNPPPRPLSARVRDVGVPLFVHQVPRGP